MGYAQMSKEAKAKARQVAVTTTNWIAVVVLSGVVAYLLVDLLTRIG